jgi:hypothetical protein
METAGQVNERMEELEKEVLYSDIGLLGYIGPNNLAEVSKVAHLGVFGFKGFMIAPAGQTFHYFQSERDLKKGMKKVAKVQ